MTIRHTITVDVEEIKAIEVRCNKCPGLVSYPIGYAVPTFLNCPGCGANLIEVSQPVSTAIRNLANALAGWKQVAEPQCHLTFTLDAPSIETPT
jgi:Zn finger protein HypA/HybF involved in hydrogenase expression